MKKRKSLNRNGKSVVYPMNKRGVIETLVIISFIVVVGAIVAGIYLINNPPTDFVGNVQLKKYYSNNCLPKIPENQRIIFPNEDSAKQLNFDYSQC